MDPLLEALASDPGCEDAFGPKELEDSNLFPFSLPISGHLLPPMAQSCRCRSLGQSHHYRHHRHASTCSHEDPLDGSRRRWLYAALLVATP
jgi:hypothetical protein